MSQAAHACKDRKPFSADRWVQNGWLHERRGNDWIRLPRMIQVPNRMSRDCRYDLRATDPRCAGCKWVATTSEGNTQ